MRDAAPRCRTKLGDELSQGLLGASKDLAAATAQHRGPGPARPQAPPRPRPLPRSGGGTERRSGGRAPRSRSVVLGAARGCSDWAGADESARLRGTEGRRAVSARRARAAGSAPAPFISSVSRPGSRVLVALDPGTPLPSLPPGADAPRPPRPRPRSPSLRLGLPQSPSPGPFPCPPGRSRFLPGRCTVAGTFFLPDPFATRYPLVYSRPSGFCSRWWEGFPGLGASVCACAWGDRPGATLHRVGPGDRAPCLGRRPAPLRVPGWGWDDFDHLSWGFL